LDKRNFLRLSGAILFGGILGPVLLLVGLRMASAVSVSLWLNMEMIATALLGRLVFRDHLGRYGWLGVMGVLAASVMLGLGETTAGIRAGLLVALACISWGIDNHLTALIDAITPAESTFWKGMVAGAVNFLIGISIHPLEAPAALVPLALVVGVFSYGISIVLYIRSAQHLGATRSQIVFASAPFWGVLLSAIFLRESMSAVQTLAMMLLLPSIAALFKDRHLHEHQHETISHEHIHEHDDLHHGHMHDGEVGDRTHSHRHEHEPVKHSHPHWPDLHHRHGH
jgi:drug/metabolite transporter (DMT)-like permease